MSELELYPDEMNRITLVWAEIQNEFIGRSDDLRTLFDLKKRVEDKFREIGFLVEVDIANQELGDDGYLYTSPVIHLYGRVVGEESHDHEKHAREVQAGLEDGIAGTVREDGSLGDSKVTLIQ